MVLAGTHLRAQYWAFSIGGIAMTDQKKPASPDSLTETGKDAKVELTEAQLKEVAGGASDIFLKLEDHKIANTLSSPALAASLNFALKI